MTELLVILGVAVLLGGGLWAWLFALGAFLDWLYSPHDFGAWWRRHNPFDPSR